MPGDAAQVPIFERFDEFYGRAGYVKWKAVAGALDLFLRAPLELRAALIRQDQAALESLLPGPFARSVVDIDADKAVDEAQLRANQRGGKRNHRKTGEA